MTPEQAAGYLVATGAGGLIVAVFTRLTGKPAVTGPEGRLADAQADKARAEAEATTWGSVERHITALAARADASDARAVVLAGKVDALESRLSAQDAEMDTMRHRLAEREIQIADLTQQLTTARVQLDHLRDVEGADKRRIAELEARVDELESAQRGTAAGAGT